MSDFISKKEDNVLYIGNLGDGNYENIRFAQIETINNTMQVNIYDYEVLGESLRAIFSEIQSIKNNFLLFDEIDKVGEFISTCKKCSKSPKDCFFCHDIPPVVFNNVIRGFYNSTQEIASELERTN